MELYVHIPFCRSKCRYCDFASWPGREADMSAYVDALLAEAHAYTRRLADTNMDTLFIGGGTPSTLPADLLDRLLTGLADAFDLSACTEFTSEANPGTLTPEWLDVAVRHGMNRLSMGMQAFQPDLLRMLGRIHTFDQVQASVAMARAAGVADISLDLMFGLPGQTLDMWRETLDAALSLGPQHLSCYGLIPEEDTPLTADLEAGRLSLPNEDDERLMYDDAIRILADHGFAQYEISNFALPGHECRHNLGYWRQVPYLGLGASASSMLPDTDGDNACLRVTNPRAIDVYLRVAGRPLMLREVVPVRRKEARFETLMLGLRTTAGVSGAEFARMHGVSLARCYGKRLRSLEQRGLLQHRDDHWALTRRGMDIQNSILVELMD